MEAGGGERWEKWQMEGKAERKTALGKAERRWRGRADRDLTWDGTSHTGRRDKWNFNEILLCHSVCITPFSLIHLFFLSPPWSFCHFQSISCLRRTSGIRRHISNLLFSPSTCVITRPWTLVNLLFYNKAGQKHLLSSAWWVNSELTSSNVTLPFQLLCSCRFLSSTPTTLSKGHQSMAMFS